MYQRKSRSTKRSVAERKKKIIADTRPHGGDDDGAYDNGGRVGGEQEEEQEEKEQEKEQEKAGSVK